MYWEDEPRQRPSPRFSFDEPSGSQGPSTRGVQAQKPRREALGPRTVRLGTPVRVVSQRPCFSRRPADPVMSPLHVASVRGDDPKTSWRATNPSPKPEAFGRVRNTAPGGLALDEP